MTVKEKLRWELHTQILGFRVLQEDEDIMRIHDEWGHNTEREVPAHSDTTYQVVGNATVIGGMGFPTFFISVILS